MNNLYTAVTKKDGNWWIRKFKNYFKRGFRILKKKMYSE